MVSQTISDTDLRHLQRCVELATEAVAAGDEPFGSILVDHAGVVLFEDRNRVKDGDHTRHPELAIAQWAGANMSVADRAQATVYTSGEHCPMCAAAHGWVGLGRIIFASSTEQLTQWLSEIGLPAGRVAPLPIGVVAPGVEALGPVPRFADSIRALHVLALR